MKSENIMIRVPTFLKQDFMQNIDAKHINASALIRSWIEEYIKENKEEKTMWEFENYTIHKETDLLRFENKDGVIIGYVQLNDYDEVEDLNNGANPIEEGWKDGMGNIINIEGWGGKEKYHKPILELPSEGLV
ncbi:hypothetical protein PB01_08725 [Psychrobacillus glaciei]|uniref:Uncharacterized protein n=1 Tax=Psychrobacillus glaciei TaxID=2283160 RepID=A0A5J6SLZ3_9BACI|nr:hypothetical protein [Psychrobacillus glaciei]QFF98908.1 hypothetical protein PB01_08725 [Psychrobacillus glaciei]